MSTQNRYRFEELLDDYLLSRLSPEEEAEFSLLMQENAEWKAEANELKAAVSTLRSDHSRVKAPAGLLSGAVKKARGEGNVLEFDSLAKEKALASAQPKPAGVPRIYLMAASIAAVAVVSAVYFANNPATSKPGSTASAKQTAFGSADSTPAMIASLPEGNVQPQTAGSPLPDSTLMFDPNAGGTDANPRRERIMNKGDGTPKADIVDKQLEIADAPPRQTRRELLEELSKKAKEEERLKAENGLLKTNELVADEVAEVTLLAQAVDAPAEAKDELSNAFSDDKIELAVASVAAEPEVTGKSEPITEATPFYSYQASETPMLALASPEAQPAPAARSMGRAELAKLPGAPKSSADEEASANAFALEVDLADENPLQVASAPIAQNDSVQEFLRAQAQATNGQEVSSTGTEQFRAQFASSTDLERFLNRLKTVPVSVRHSSASSLDSSLGVESTRENRPTAMLPGYRAMRSARTPATSVSVKQVAKPVIEEFNFSGTKGVIEVNEAGEYVISIGEELESGKPLPEVLRDLQPVARY